MGANGRLRTVVVHGRSRGGARARRAATSVVVVGLHLDYDDSRTLIFDGRRGRGRIC